MSTLQFKKDLGYPIYIKLDEEGFYPEILKNLEYLGFEKLEDDLHSKDLISIPNARLLHIKEASNIVARQIDQATDSDRYGYESLIQQEGYKVYRFSRQAMMIYSYAVIDWEMACFSDFGMNEADITDFNIIMNRFLAFALAPLGVVGFWGSLQKDELILSKKEDSIGEVVHFDVYKMILIDQNGVHKLRPRFKVVKPDRFLKTEKIIRSREEFLSLLNFNTSYMDLSNNMPIRQILRRLVQDVHGVLRPIETSEKLASI